MKNLKLFKTLLIAIGLFATSLTSPVWADWFQHNNQSHIYFNDYTTNWVSDPSSNGIAFLMGRDDDYWANNKTAGKGSQAYRMTHIANTKIWYCNVPSWGNSDPDNRYQYTAFRFVSGTTGWNDWQGGWDNRPTARAQYGSNTKYTMTKNVSITNATKLFTPSGSSSNTDVSIGSSLTKYTAYLRVRYDDDRDGTYDACISDKNTWPHGVKFDFTGTYMTSASASAQSKISNLNVNGWDDNGNWKWGYDFIPVTGEVRFELKAIDTGFEVAGWAYSESATSPAYTPEDPKDVTFQVLSETSYVAFVRRKQYTVTLNDNGGSGGSGSKTVKYDLSSNMTTSVSVPSKLGYTFQGYYTGQDGTGSMVINASGVWQKNVTNYTGTDGSSNPKWIRDGDVTLYAKWTQSVTLDREGGTTGSTSVTATYKSTTLGSFTNPGKTGYTFAGYYSGDNGTNQLIINTSQVLQANKTDGVAYTGAGGKWIHDAATTLYAKWTANPYTVTLENLGADVGHKGTENVSVTYDATTNLTSAITKPEKTHYDFGGYYTSEDEGETLGTQLIDANGNWEKSIDGYTGASGGNPTWVYAGDITLYAKWTEHEYTITTAVSPAGAGSISCGASTTAKYVTASGDITATANAGWIFKEWQFSKTGEDYDIYCKTGDYSTTNPVHIHAVHNGTLTAVFEPRYYLVGGEIMSGEDVTGTGTSSGMPGWDNYTEPFNVITSSPVLATCSLTLGANKHFYIMVRDKADGLSYGKSKETLEDNESLIFTDQDNRVLFHSNGGTAYTFKITAINGSGRPTVSVERPYQVNIGRKRVDIDGTDHDDNTGGTVAMSETLSGDAISNGAWVPYGISVKYDASKQTGYTVDWYTASDYVTWFSNADYWFHTATSTGNGYAKFTEVSTAVTLSNDGHGHVEIGGNTETSTTCGVTTTRELTAVPDDGYSFSSWTTSSTPDFEVDDTNEETVTLTGHGAGTAGTLTANFSPISYTVTLNDDHGGSNNGSATVDYDATALTVTSHATFLGWTLLGYWNADGNQVTDASGNLQSSVTNYTSSTGEWKYVGNVTLYAHWSRSVTLDREGGTTGAESVTVTYKGSSLSGFSAPTKTGYDFTGYYTGDNGTGSMVISTGGELQADVSGYTNGSSQWTKTDATTLYAGWTAKTFDGTIDGVTGTDGAYTATYGAKTIDITTPPSRTGYDVGGYYLNYNVEANPQYYHQIATVAGALIESTDYTDGTGKWTYTGDAPTIYASWVPKTYTITLDANLGGIPGTNGSTSFTVTIGSNNFDFDLSIADRQSMTPPTKEGYTFAGYYDDPDEGEGTKVINSDGSKPSTSYVDSDGNWKCSTEPLTLYAHWTDNGTYYFKGGTSGNETSWNTASNWTKGQAPDDATDDVYILAPVVIPASATTTVNSVRIATNGSYRPTGSATPIAAAGKLTIPATAMLKVTTDVQNYDFSTSSASATTSATLHIQSASSGNGALVWGTSGTPGGAQVDFYTISSAKGEGRGTTSDVNQYIGTPFSDESNYYNYYNSWVFEVDYSSLTWKRLPMGSTMNPFVGYDVIYDGAAGHVFEMEGTLVTNADRSVSALNATESVLANSWVAPIKINGFEKSDFSGPNAAIYIFNSTSEALSAGDAYGITGGGNYSTYTPGSAEETDVIPSMQSFSVTGGTGTVSLDYAKLVKTPASHSLIGSMKAPRRAKADETEPEEELEPKMERLKIHVSDENGWGDLLKICIREDFVEEFENGFDARKMYGDERAPMLYGMSIDGMMAIHCIPTAENQVVGFHAGTASSEYTFRFTYDGEEELYLKDTKLNTLTLIDNENSYHFYAAPSDSDMRFIIVKNAPQNPTGVDKLGTDANVQKIMHDGVMYILRGGRIYDATGALVK